MVLCVSDAANAEGEKGAMKFRWQRKPLGMSIDCGGRGEGGGDEGLARTRGGYVADQGARAAKMKSAPGPGTTDLGYSTTPHPTKGVCLVLYCSPLNKAVIFGVERLPRIGV